MNLASFLPQAAKAPPKKTAVIFGGEKLSFARLYQLSAKIAAGLVREGVVPGDRVALFLTNRPEFIASYYGCQLAGAVCVSISSASKPGEVSYLLGDSGAKMLLTEKELEGNLPPSGEIGEVKKIYSVGGDFESLFAGRGEFPPLEMASDDGAAMLYTSGTTGNPKGVLLTHGNVVSNTDATAQVCGILPEDRTLCFLPIYHSFGQNFIMNTALRAGTTLVLHKKFDAAEVLASVKKNKVTRFPAVPAVYIRLLGERGTKTAFSTVRYCFSAASPMPLEVARKWKALTGKEIHEGYGLTESSPFSLYNHAEKIKPGSVGTPVPGVEARAIDHLGREAKPGVLGEIVLRGPNIMKGYWGREEETKAAVVDGWLRTGDIGYRDEEGYFYLVDRIKEMINCAGLKVWPREVEEALYAHPMVKECAVAGVPHEVYGETVKGFVVPAVEGWAEESELREFLMGKLSDYKIPRIFEFRESLPKSPAGKIIKRLLVQR